MTTWEYKTIQVKTHGALGGLVDIDDFDSKLNELGQLGWELVTSTTVTQDLGSARRILAIFKRPLND
jgi:hypothetical protein